MSAEETVSSCARREGNKHYERAMKQENLGPCARLELYRDAIRCYNQALSSAPAAPPFTSDLVAAYKNLALANWRASAEVQRCPGGDAVLGGSDKAKLTLYYIEESVLYFSRALESSPSSHQVYLSSQQSNSPQKTPTAAGVESPQSQPPMQRSWYFDLRVKFKKVVEDALELCSKAGKDYTERLAFLRKLRSTAESVSSPEHLLCAASKELYLALLEQHFRYGVTATEEKNFRCALAQFAECHFYNEMLARQTTQLADPGEHRALEMKEDEHYAREARVYIEDVRVQSSVAESLQMLAQGEQLLAAAVEDEGLEMDLVYDALDSLMRSVALTHENCIEVECIALSRLGRIYSQVLKSKSRARDYYGRVIQLALTLIPRNVHEEEWYKEASEFVQKIQDEAVQRDEAATADKKAKAKEAIAEDLKKLDELQIKHKDDVDAFLKALYEAFPPKREGCKKHYNSNRGVKQAMVDYSPDKQQEEVHGYNWVVFCEEVQKLLNSKF